MPSGAASSSPSLPRKLLDYITEVHRRSGVKLDVARVRTGSIDIDFDAQKQEADQQRQEEMDMFARPETRPRSRSGFQATSPLAIAQRKNAAESAQQRPKSAYLLNGHCELNSSVKDTRDGYHTDGDDDSHYHARTYCHAMSQYRRMHEAPISNSLVDTGRFSSASSICSSEDEDNTDSWLSFRKSQSDIGTMRMQSVDQNNELQERIKQLEKQNELLKQQLQDKTMKDEATQVQQYSVVCAYVCVCACMCVCLFTVCNPCICVCVCVWPDAVKPNCGHLNNQDTCPCSP